MVDQPDYRPATRRDFRDAITGVDASALKADDLRADQETRVPDAYDARDDGRTLHDRVTDRDADGVPDRLERNAYRDRDVAAAPVATTERAVVDDPYRRPFSVAAGFFGWAVASFFTLVLSTIVLALIGASAYDATNAATAGLNSETFNDLTTMGLIGLGVAVLAAYFLGGYAAGRIGLWHGVGHGVAVVAWTVLFAVLAVALGAWLGDQVNNVYVTPAVDWSAVTGPTVVGLLVTLALMLLGAILGAVLGARTDTEDDAVGVRRRAYRGRPL